MFWRKHLKHVTYRTYLIIERDKDIIFYLLVLLEYHLPTWICYKTKEFSGCIFFLLALLIVYKFRSLFSMLSLFLMVLLCIILSLMMDAFLVATTKILFEDLKSYPIYFCIELFVLLGVVQGSMSGFNYSYQICQKKHISRNTDKDNRPTYEQFLDFDAAAVSRLCFNSHISQQFNNI